MTFNAFFKITDQTGLSPEQLAPKLGISNMTFRRWRKQKGTREIPSIHRQAILDGVFQLVRDGILDGNNNSVQEFLRNSSRENVSAILREVGVDLSKFEASRDFSKPLQSVLSRIGVSEKHRDAVDNDSAKIARFKKLGADWKKSISTLQEAITSVNLTLGQKYIAYGALFYLIWPFDLVPDHLPVVGLADDFAILTAAAGLYVSNLKESASSKRTSKSKNQ